MKYVVILATSATKDIDRQSLRKYLLGLYKSFKSAFVEINVHKHTWYKFFRI